MPTVECVDKDCEHHGVESAMPSKSNSTELLPGLQAEDRLAMPDQTVRANYHATTVNIDLVRVISVL